jgi:LPS O-antigen subunit length determinant protein (WzzB/FepE family)
MIKNYLLFFIFYLTLTACGQNKNSQTIIGLTIEPNIKDEVEKHIENSKELDMFKNKMQVYLNSGFVESYQSDSLVFSSKNQNSKAPFKSFYFWKGDTLIIDGAFGLFGGMGFGIEICNNNARLYHMLSSDDYPSYAYKEKDSLIFRLEVPCLETKIILSEIPDSTKKQIIYGYVEFKSQSYFSSSGSADGEEILPRQKLRSNMKLYFKSGKLDL